MFVHRELARDFSPIANLCHWMWLSCDLGAANRCCIGNSDLGDEAVSAPSNGFHEAGTLGRVAERFTDFVDRFVEPVVEIHKSVCGPKVFLKFLASYDLAGMLKEHRQNLEGLFLKPNSQAVLAQLACLKIQFEYPETQPPTKFIAFSHG
jgi:hypothetical protein